MPQKLHTWDTYWKKVRDGCHLLKNKLYWISQPPKPGDKSGDFLGLAGFCRLWIPGFAKLAKPFYEATRGTKESFLWNETPEGAFKAIKEALLKAPALVLPDINKPFQLFIDERSGVAKGVLTQCLGPWEWQVDSLFKQLDPVASGWPSCPCIIAATALC